MPEPQLDTRLTAEDTLLLILSGRWQIDLPVPSGAHTFEHLLAGSRVRQIQFDSSGLAAWDSSLIGFIHQLRHRCAAAEIEVDLEGLPGGARRLARLAAAVPPRRMPKKSSRDRPLLKKSAMPAWLATRRQQTPSNF